VNPVRLVEAAEQELLAASAYYDIQKPGLGAEFLDQVERALCDIAAHPERWPCIRLGMRRRLLHRFPYGLLYKIDPAETIVLAVAHLHRHPNYWVGRT
jgi:toxin ParE2